MSQPVVSVIVAAYNSEDGVARLLEALERQTLPREQWELIVADDSSTDETGEVVRRSGLGRVVGTARRGGSYAARNLALEEATGAVIAVTDADCLPAADWLERGLGQLEVRGVDILGGGIEMPLSKRPSLAELLDATAGLDQELYVNELGFVATANAFVRREVFDRIGGFNAQLISGGDVEFSRRGTEAGFKLAYAPEARIEHPPRRLARSVFQKSLRVGFGMGQWRHVGGGPMRTESSRLWTDWRQWRPRHGVPGMEKLAARSGGIGRGKLIALDLAHYALMQLPMVVGNLGASIRRGRGL